ncbi:MAG: acylphosphatase [Balneolaceae bacterium]
MLKHLKIRGRVQGVGYRYFTLQNARELGVNGWVKNRLDGSVEVLLSGSQNSVNELIRRLHQGPFSARVDDIMEMDTEPNPDMLSDFQIKR